MMRGFREERDRKRQQAQTASASDTAIQDLTAQIRQLREQQAQSQQRRQESIDPSTYASQFGGIISQPGELERVDVTRPEEIAQLVQMRREGAQGLTAPQYAVAREQMMAQQGAAEQAAQRQLARQQAIAGIRGGAAGKQSSRLAQQLAQQRAMQEQGLFLTDVGEKQRGMAAYEQTLGSAIQGEQARRLFNIEQQQREQLAQQARELTIAQLAQQSALGERQAQAAEYYAGQMSRAGGGGGKIICTELHRQGLMDEETFRADQIFGQYMKKTYPEVMVGYWAFAKPVVTAMRTSKAVTYIVAAVALPWAKHMAHVVDKGKKDSFIGRAIMTIGLPFCKFIAKITRTQEVV